MYVSFIYSEKGAMGEVKADGALTDQKQQQLCLLQEKIYMVCMVSKCNILNKSTQFVEQR